MTAANSHQASSRLNSRRDTDASLMRTPSDRDEAPATRRGCDRRTVPAQRADLERIEMMHLCLACYRGGVRRTRLGEQRGRV
jgi:hypothetical protein